MRLTIDEYSKQFKMSKEMINSKLRAKKINYVIEDSVTYIIVSNNNSINNTEQEAPKQKVTKQIVATTHKTTVATVLALYQRENRQLKEKINQLEEKIDKLINDKEQMLRDERDKIESLYTAKDEQLKNILELINSKLILEKESQTIHEIDALPINDAKIEQKKEHKESLQVIELLEYLKTLKLKSSQRKMIKKRFLSVYDSDIRIQQQNGKLYLDFSKYDYSDLLEY